MVEESIPYKLDILGLSPDEFRIRINSPGEPVDITLVPAETPPLVNAPASRSDAAPTQCVRGVVGLPLPWRTFMMAYGRSCALSLSWWSWRPRRLHWLEAANLRRPLLNPRHRRPSPSQS